LLLKRFHFFNNLLKSEGHNPQHDNTPNFFIKIEIYHEKINYLLIFLRKMLYYIKKINKNIDN